MYCKKCQQELYGRFCSHCGTDNKDIYISQNADTSVKTHIDTAPQNSGESADTGKSPCAQPDRQSAADGNPHSSVQSIGQDHAQGKNAQEQNAQDSGTESLAEKPCDNETESYAVVPPQFWDKCSQSVADALEMQQKYNQTGTIDREFLSSVKKGSCFNETVNDVSCLVHNNPMGETAPKKTQKEALKALLEKKCPDCTQPFETGSYCRCCGASLMPESYGEA